MSGDSRSISYRYAMAALMLLDSASMYFRSFYGVKGEVNAPDGTPVGAVRGFLDAVASLVASRKPTHLVACWDDDWRPAFRVEAIPSYKAHRVVGGAAAASGGVAAEEVPSDLERQVPIIVEVLAAVGIARVGAIGCEADDVMGTLATRAVAAGRVESVDIVSGDRDLFQLVDDPATTPGGVAVRVLYTGRGMRNLEIVDSARLTEKYNVASGQAYADMAALRGDPSDGLPGVPGVGEKTAAGLLATYGNIAGVIEAATTSDPRLSPTVRGKLIASLDYLAVAPRVVNVLRDAELPDHNDTLPRQPRDPETLDALAVRWGLESSMKRLLAALESVGE